MLRRWRRWFLIAGLALLPLVVVVVMVHLPTTQRWAWARIADSIEASSGWQVRTDTVAVRLWPARLRLAGLSVTAPDRDQPVVAVERIVARWRWIGLRGTPRVDRLEIEGVSTDLRHLPAAGPEEPEPAPAEPLDPWTVVEIGRLELRHGGVEAPVTDIDLAVREVQLDGQLVAGRGRLRLRAGELTASRQGRVVRLGPLELEVSGSSEQVVIERCRLDGDDLRVTLTGSAASLPEGYSPSAQATLEADLAALTGWWDPELAASLGARGRVVLETRIEQAPGGELRLEVEHTGQPVRIAGYVLDQLQVYTRDGGLGARVAGSGWGSVSAVLRDDQVVASVQLDRAPVDPALALVPGGVPDGVPRQVRLSGDVEATVPLPFALETLSVLADLEARDQDGLRLRLRGGGQAGAFEVDTIDLEAPGARVAGAASLRAADRVEADLELAIADPATLLATVARWWPPAADLGAGGGPIDGRVSATGVLADPSLDVELRWQRPALGDRVIEELTASVKGRLASLEWSAAVVLVPGATASASGTAEPKANRATGRWRLEAPEIRELLTWARVELTEEVHGNAWGEGELAWDSGDWRVSGLVEVSGVSVGAWRGDELLLELAADQDRLVLETVSLRALGGVLQGSASLELGGLDAPLAAAFRWADLDLASLPVDLPPQALGVLSGELTVTGTVARPEGELTFGWMAASEAAPVQRLRLRAALAEGEVRLLCERLETAAGPLTADGRVGLGAMPLPDWLWSEAPSAPVRLTVRGVGLRSGPLVAALGLDALPAEVHTDLLLDVLWDLEDPAARAVELELSGLEIRTAVSTLTTGKPVVVTLHGHELVLAPVSIVGPRLHLAVEQAEIDLAEQTIAVRAEAVLDPAVARLVPVAMHIDEPLYVEIEVSGPLTAPDGRFKIEHGDGLIVIRDPPMELAGLVLDGDIVDGVLSVSGEARLNRGRLYIGGGWDPASDQGVVLELDGVTFVLPYGIVSRWSGEAALEPDPERLFQVVGELVLDGGVWDQPIDLAGLLLGPGSAPVAADDPTHDIGLDLSIRGRGGVHVDNNLGEFDVGWNLLSVGGTAAAPVIEGEVRLASGGEISLGGRRMRIRRGVIEFTGEPGAEPRVDIVPEEDPTQGTGEGFDADLAARKGLARGLGQALGLENETLQPAEIAIQTETDPGSRFMVGQRISRQIALFFSTDLSNPQDQVTTLQLWNLPGLRGLALQAFTDTERENDGFAVLEHISWGGTEATDDRPMIHKLRLDGDWPVSKRRLKKATGLGRGEPFDDFMLFVAGLRLERELAAAGFHDARVHGRAEGDERLPALHFECDPGPRQLFSFAGDRPSRAIRRELISMYHPPPFEGSALSSMRETLDRRLGAEGFPSAVVSVARVDDVIVVDVARGAELELSGPVVEGLPPEAASELELVLGGSAQLAELLRDPEAAKDPITRVLRGMGFRRAEVRRIWAEDLEQGKARVRLDIEPGPRSEVAGVRVDGHDPLGLVASPEFPIQPGTPLDRSVIDIAVSRLRRQYRAEGFTEVHARSHLAEAEPGRWVVELKLEPGAKRTVTGIEFTGLRHLSGKVLGRSFPLAEGDLLTTAELDQGVVELSQFAPVERIDARTRPDGRDGVRVEVHVTEKKRWTAGLGVRWGTERGGEVLFNLRDDSLLGRGVTANLRGIWGEQDKRAAFLVGVPPPPGGKLAYGLVASYEEEDVAEDVREERSRLTLESSYALTMSSSLKGYARVARTHTFELEPLDPDFALDATFDFLTLGTGYVRDRFDNPFDPRSGYYLGADLSWSSEISEGSSEYLKLLLTGSLALEPWTGWTWAQTLRLGLSDPQGGVLPPTTDARFFAGGQASIRGFPKDAVGPVGFLGDAVGGGALLLLNQELRMPLWKMFRFAVFADGGNVWPSWDETEAEIAVGAGAGLRVSTPVGLIWGDVAWPVNDPQEAGDGVQYYFGIGKTF